MKRTVIILVLVIIVLGVGMLVYKNYKGPDAVQEPGAATAPVLDASNKTIEELTVIGDNFSFSPSSLTAKKGDIVRIIFKNANGFHDLKIDELGVATKRIQGGGEDVVEFTAEKIGSFEYYCSVGSHRAMGMKGILTVEK